MNALSPEDHRRINAAIAEAETRTAGEIFCIVQRHASEYRDTPLAWAAALALVGPAVLIPFGFSAAWFDWVPGLGGWTAGHASAAEGSAAQTLIYYAVVQAAVFLLAAAIISIRPLRTALTPGALKRERAHRAALEQFLAKGLHLTEGRTGVLIFASLGDRQAEVIADEGIYKKVKPEVWNEALSKLTAGMKAGQPADGFIGAIGLCGAVLAEHFPPGSQNPNEVPDTLVEI